MLRLRELFTFGKSKVEDTPPVVGEAIEKVKTEVASTAVIGIEHIKEEPPDFKTKYTVQITPEVKIRVDAYWSSIFNARRWDGELKQKNGSWIAFDPKKVADKIIDHDLVPLVEDCLKLIFKADAEFNAPAQRTFIDKRGQKWMKVDE